MAYPRRFTDDELRAFWFDPRTLAEIAGEVGTSQPRLSMMLRRLGLGRRQMLPKGEAK